MAFKSPEDARDRIALTRKLVAFYRAETKSGATITTEMIEAAIACDFDRAKINTRPSRRNTEPITTDN